MSTVKLPKTTRSNNKVKEGTEGSRLDTGYRDVGACGTPIIS